MVAEITNGVKVSVITEYQPDYSSPMQHHYVFTYKVFIENNSAYTIQLLSRKWSIYDSNHSIKQVEGEGVVGQQPVIEPGESHQYISGCNLRTSMGKMCGHYVMERMLDGERFEVIIPEFHMIAPFRLN